MKRLLRESKECNVSYKQIQPVILLCYSKDHATPVRAMRKRRPQIVPGKANALISNLSLEEEARALALADVALHNSPPDKPLLAGERAKIEHRRLMEQLERAAEKA